MLVQETN